MGDDPLLTGAEAAKFLRVSTATVLRERVEGRLGFISIRRRYMRQPRLHQSRSPTGRDAGGQCPRLRRQGPGRSAWLAGKGPARRTARLTTRPDLIAQPAVDLAADRP